MKTLIASSALSIAFLAGSAHAITLDLTIVGNSGAINGAQFFQYSGALPTGTFLKIQNNGIESGYNTDGVTQFNTGSTHAIKLSDIPLVNGVNGFRQFALNINEVASGTNGLLSLDQVQLFVTDSATLTGYNTTTGTFTGATKVYDMDASVDNWVQLDYNVSDAYPGAGASKADMLMYVPNANFSNASDDSYIVLYSKFGGQGSGSSSSDGSEEWSINKLTGAPVPVPVPAAAWLLGSGLIGLAGIARRKS